MDMVRRITLLFPAQTFVIAADWLLLAAEVTHQENTTGERAGTDSSYFPHCDKYELLDV